MSKLLALVYDANLRFVVDVSPSSDAKLLLDREVSFIEHEKVI